MLILKNKKFFNIILDIFMLVVLLLSYYRQILGWQYHEYIGIIFPILAIIHMFINHKWAKNTIKKAFSKNCNITTRISCIINILLFISVFLVIYSGILISRTILTGISSSNEVWKSVHGVTAKSTLILAFLHLICHLKFIKNILFNYFLYRINYTTNIT